MAAVLAQELARARHRICQRGYGVLVSRSSGERYPAPCRNWRECQECARAYGIALSKRWSRVRGLRAFAVLTMPPKYGDWRDPANRFRLSRSWAKLRQRLNRRISKGELAAGSCLSNFDKQDDKQRAGRGLLKYMFFKEHAGANGRLHLNVLWDLEWIDQGELARLAAECGFGPVTHISRIRADETRELSRGRPGRSASVRYSMKSGFRVRAYARKTGSATAAGGDDWAKGTRRWSASRSANAEMGKREPNPDWYWSAIDPPRIPIAADDVPLCVREPAPVEFDPGDFYVRRMRDGPPQRPLPDWLLEAH